MKQSKLPALVHYFEVVERWLNWGAAGAICALGLLVVGQVFLRIVYHSPPGVYDLVKFIVVATVWLALAHTQKVHGHVRMELFIESLPYKAHHILELLYLVIWLVTFSVITVFSAKSALLAYQVGDTTMGVISFPLWPPKSLLPLGSLFICLRFLIQIAEHFVALKSPPSPVTSDTVEST